MQRAVHIEVVSKAPPGGRCEFYDRLFFYLVRASTNLYYTLIPENLREGEVRGPAVLIDGKPLIPEDGILLTPEEILRSLKEAGVEFREEEEGLRHRLRKEYEKFTGGE